MEPNAPFAASRRRAARSLRTLPLDENHESVAAVREPALGSCGVDGALFGFPAAARITTSATIILEPVDGAVTLMPLRRRS